MASGLWSRKCLNSITIIAAVLFKNSSTANNGYERSYVNSYFRALPDEKASPQREPKDI